MLTQNFEQSLYFLVIIATMNKEYILNYLTNIKSIYAQEGFLIQALFGSYSRDDADATSDIDILVEATPQFASRYGFQSIARIHQIQNELSQALGVRVDLADRTGMGKTAQKFIIDRAIYV
jgi:hypothetical protein